MRNKDFCVFILTHGRQGNVIKLKTLEKAGYSGKLYFVVDNEDKTLSAYIKNFWAERVKIFDKKFYADNVDEGNNFDERRTITHARNACFDIAEELGITYFLELDDDYSSFNYKLVGVLHNTILIKDINKIFDLHLDFYKTIPALSIAFAQEGDF